MGGLIGGGRVPLFSAVPDVGKLKSEHENGYDPKRIALDAGKGLVNSAAYLLLPFVITWLSDSGAFFVGRSMGKTKLAPALSPHKTVEGCVGGFVCAIAAAMLYGLVLHLCGYRVQIGLLAIYGFFGSLAGQTGDLAFSAIKREHGVKDYSNLLPGHGGMLDRFDSTIFTAPMLELLVLLAPAIAVVAQ